MKTFNKPIPPTRPTYPNENAFYKKNGMLKSKIPIANPTGYKTRIPLEEIIKSADINLEATDDLMGHKTNGVYIKAPLGRHEHTWFICTSRPRTLKELEHLYSDELLDHYKAVEVYENQLARHKLAMTKWKEFHAGNVKEQMEIVKKAYETSIRDLEKML